MSHLASPPTLDAFEEALLLDDSPDDFVLSWSPVVVVVETPNIIDASPEVGMGSHSQLPVPNKRSLVLPTPCLWGARGRCFMPCHGSSFYLPAAHGSLGHSLFNRGLREDTFWIFVGAPAG